MGFQTGVAPTYKKITVGDNAAFMDEYFAGRINVFGTGMWSGTAASVIQPINGLPLYIGYNTGLDIHIKDRFVFDTLPYVEPYITPTMQNGWANYGGTFEPAGYMKDPLGFVHIRGLIKNGTIGTTAFTLPAGYRPQYTVVSAVNDYSGEGAIYVQSDGQVLVNRGSTSFTSLVIPPFQAYQ